MKSSDIEELCDLKIPRNVGGKSKNWRRDCHNDDITENKEDITLIWLDEQIDDSIEFQQTLDTLRQLNDYILLYTNPQLCISYIQSVINEKILLILSNDMAKTMLSQVHSIQTVVSIFVYFSCDIDLSQYSKDIIQCDDQISLIKSIQDRVRRISKQSITFSLFHNKTESSIRDVTHNPASFLWFHLLIDVLKHLPHTFQAKEQMIDVCKKYYQTNFAELDKIKQFEEKYQPSNAILWYTENSFIYKLMNKALRIDDIYLLYLIRFYIIDLCQQIECESENYLSSFSSITLYRGQMMDKNEFENLQANIGNLISPNGFFSTSKDLNVALMYVDQENDQFKSILFKIRIDRTTMTTSLIEVADIEKLSRFPWEKEVLFSIGTTFKIETITYDFQLKTWSVQMILTNEGLEFIQEHINSMRNNLTETNPTRLFGKLLIDMGQYSSAERYFKLVLESLPKNHEDFPSLYHGLGYVNYVRGNYAKAIEYDVIGYKIRKRTLPADHLDVAKSALNLGCDYKKNGDQYIAMDLLREALDIRMTNYSGEDHSNIAIVFAAIGETCIHLGDYRNAFDYLTKGLEMFKRVLPSKHQEIAGTLIKIGYFFEKQCEYDRALQYYHSGHEMAENVMRGDHPRLKQYFQTIIDLYKRINHIDDAIQFCTKKLASQRESLGEIHPNIAEIYTIIGDLTIHIEHKLYNYYQAIDIQQKCRPNDEQAIGFCQSKIDAIQCLSE